MDNELVAAIEYQHDQLKKPASGIGTNDKPTSRIILIIQGAEANRMTQRVTHRIVSETIPTKVLARGSVQLKRHSPSSARRRGQPRNGL